MYIILNNITVAIFFLNIFCVSSVSGLPVIIISDDVQPLWVI
jgi:hypothetical protein